MAGLFDAKLALFHKNAKSKEEVLKILADEFIKSGVSKESFYEGLVSRENDFPTGLTLNKMCVAIPHTDAEYVNTAQVGFISLNEPVEFVEMGTEGKVIPVKMVFMLALTENHQHVDMLMKLMDVFQNDELMERFYKVDDYDSYFELVKEAGLENC